MNGSLIFPRDAFVGITVTHLSNKVILHRFFLLSRGIILPFFVDIRRFNFFSSYGRGGGQVLHPIETLRKITEIFRSNRNLYE